MDIYIYVCVCVNIFPFLPKLVSIYFLFLANRNPTRYKFYEVNFMITTLYLEKKRKNMFTGLKQVAQGHTPSK